MFYARRPSCLENLAYTADSTCCNDVKIMAYNEGLIANAGVRQSGSSGDEADQAGF